MTLAGRNFHGWYFLLLLFLLAPLNVRPQWKAPDFLEDVPDWIHANGESRELGPNDIVGFSFSNSGRLHILDGSGGLHSRNRNGNWRERPLESYIGRTDSKGYSGGLLEALDSEEETVYLVAFEGHYLLVYHEDRSVDKITLAYSSPARYGAIARTSDCIYFMAGMSSLLRIEPSGRTTCIVPQLTQRIDWIANYDLLLGEMEFYAHEKCFLHRPYKSLLPVSETLGIYSYPWRYDGIRPKVSIDTKSWEQRSRIFEEFLPEHQRGRPFVPLNSRAYVTTSAVIAIADLFPSEINVHELYYMDLNSNSAAFESTVLPHYGESDFSYCETRNELWILEPARRVPGSTVYTRGPFHVYSVLTGAHIRSESIVNLGLEDRFSSSPEELK